MRACGWVIAFGFNSSWGLKGIFCFGSWKIHKAAQSFRNVVLRITSNLFFFSNLQAGQAKDPHAQAHRWATLYVPALQLQVCAQLRSEEPSAYPYGRAPLPVRALLQKLHPLWPPAPAHQAPELPRVTATPGTQTLLLLALLLWLLLPSGCPPTTRRTNVASAIPWSTGACSTARKTAGFRRRWQQKESDRQEAHLRGCEQEEGGVCFCPGKGGRSTAPSLLPLDPWSLDRETGASATRSWSCKLTTQKPFRVETLRFLFINWLRQVWNFPRNGSAEFLRVCKSYWQTPDFNWCPFCRLIVGFLMWCQGF